MIGIYKITNKINGKYYIGQSVDTERRRQEHFKPYRRNKAPEKDRPLYQDIKKYGKDNFKFEVIKECDVKDLDKWEIYYLKNAPKEKLYNVAIDAIPMHDPNENKKHGQFFHNWNKKQWKKKSYREERSKASSKLQKERLKNPDYLAEKSAQLKKYTDSLKKKVAQYDKQGNLIAIYNGVREAERITGVPSQLISNVALHKKHRKTAKGFKWEYL